MPDSNPIKLKLFKQTLRVIQDVKDSIGRSRERSKSVDLPALANDMELRKDLLKLHNEQLLIQAKCLMTGGHEMLRYSTGFDACHWCGYSEQPGKATKPSRMWGSLSGERWG